METASDCEYCIYCRKLVRDLEGGPGSGNWGHVGRPGERGGSSPGNNNSTRTIFREGDDFTPDVDTGLIYDLAHDNPEDVFEYDNLLMTDISKAENLTGEYSESDVFNLKSDSDIIDAFNDTLFVDGSDVFLNYNEGEILRNIDEAFNKIIDLRTEDLNAIMDTAEEQYKNPEFPDDIDKYKNGVAEVKKAYYKYCDEVRRIHLNWRQKVVDEFDKSEKQYNENKRSAT